MCNHQSPCGLLPPHGQVVPPRPTPFPAGSASLWIYSTLLLQLRVPNDILGRMSAVEMVGAPV